MKKILIDYFGEWRTGQLGRTRFFALAFLGSILGTILSLTVTIILVGLGVISQSPPAENLPTDGMASILHLMNYSSQDLSVPVQQFGGAAAQGVSVHAPWWVAAPILHLFLANISIKRLRDMGLPGRRVYLGAHTVVAPTHFLFGASGFAGLLLFLFSCLLLFTPTKGLK